MGAEVDIVGPTEWGNYVRELGVEVPGAESLILSCEAIRGKSRIDSRKRSRKFSAQKRKSSIRGTGGGAIKALRRGVSKGPGRN